MKEFFLKVIGLLIRAGVFIFALYIVLSAIEQSLPKKKIQEEFKEKKREIEGPLKEIKEKVIPEVKLPEKGLKIFAEIEIQTTTTASFILSGIVDGNDLYWKIDIISDLQDQLKTFQFLQNSFFGWKKFEVKNEKVEELKKLKEILEKDGIFKRFERVERGYEFEIDAEKLKNRIFDWKEEIPRENIEGFFKNFKKISGKLLVDEKNMAKRIELEGNYVNAIIKIENLEEEMLRKEKEEKLDVENLLISIFENLLFI